MLLMRFAKFKGFDLSKRCKGKEFGEADKLFMCLLEGREIPPPAYLELVGKR